MDFDTIKPTNYFVFITEGDTYKIVYYNTTEVAVNYAKLFCKYNPNYTIGQLNNVFDKVKSYNPDPKKKKPGIFSGKQVARHVEIANGRYFPNCLWDKKNYLPKLLTMIDNNNNNPIFNKDFTYEAIY